MNKRSCVRAASYGTRRSPFTNFKASFCTFCRLIYLFIVVIFVLSDQLFGERLFEGKRQQTRRSFNLTVINTVLILLWERPPPLPFPLAIFQHTFKRYVCMQWHVLQFLHIISYLITLGIAFLSTTCSLKSWMKYRIFIARRCVSRPYCVS